VVAYVKSLRARARVAVLSNIPADHADAFLAAQPWLRNLDHIALSGKIDVAKPDPAAFYHCVTALHGAPADFLFVDDREENVRAAQAIGMTGCVFTGLDDLAKAINTWLTFGAGSPTCQGSTASYCRIARHGGRQEGRAPDRGRSAAIGLVCEPTK
jgi:putative hydrolase of the HAD superfamily